MSTAVSQLQVEDEEFLVASLIDRCPKTMMLRELVHNAIEAAMTAPTGSKRVDIDSVELYGARKIRIRNTGPGMDEAGLYSMCDLASSIGKIKGLDKNFGMGAKVATLPSNHFGVRYRSCARGRVHEVILGKRNGVYGRVLRPKTEKVFPDAGRLTDILDVTEMAREENIDLSQDWTEVVLLGMRPEQDTVADPYDGDPIVEAHWLPRYLYHRYFRLPADVEIRISPDFHWRENVSAFETLSQRAERSFARYESVSGPDGLTLHYFYDPTCIERPWENTSSEGAIQTAMGEVAMIFRDEIFDAKSGSPWAYDAPIFGITFAARNISVYIELPEACQVRTDMYRQSLVSAVGAQQTLASRDYAAVVRAGRPNWLVKIIEGMRSGHRSSSDVIGDLARLSRQLGLQALEKAAAAASSETDVPASAARDSLGFDIVLLHSEQDINDRWLRGRAASFYPETMQLFINTKYTATVLIARELRDKVVSYTEIGKFAEIIENVVLDCLITRTTRALIFGISKHLNKEDWQFGHIEKAMSPESLSIAADDFHHLIPWAESEVRRRIEERDKL